VAIAGRIKAGKSTLLNALVGERVAATDAGECTRIVAWYQQGLGYEVVAEFDDGDKRAVPFRRGDELTIDLDGLMADDVRRLLVSWPSEELKQLTLIDTPGLASLDAVVSRRTLRALGADGATVPDADVVVYLMRHLHRIDAAFLDGFVTGADAAASPVNSLAVLSRADEIGAGRLDAMISARRIAEAYARDPRVASMSSTVVAIAGLVAETAQTLTDAEFRALRDLAGLPEDVLGDLLLSVDRFVASHDAEVHRHTGLDVARRQVLADRLGLFGVRFATDQVRRGANSTVALAAALLEVSGLEQMRSELHGRIAPRAQVLQARSVLLTLADVASRSSASDPDRSAALARAIERTVAAAHEFAELRLAHLVATGMTSLPLEAAARAARLVAAGPIGDRLGLSEQPSSDDVRSAALVEIDWWRTYAANPTFDPLTVEACTIAARTAEGLYAAAAS
jgi:hypothetical protein